MNFKIGDIVETSTTAGQFRGFIGKVMGETAAGDISIEVRLTPEDAAELSRIEQINRQFVRLSENSLLISVPAMHVHGYVERLSNYGIIF